MLIASCHSIQSALKSNRFWWLMLSLDLLEALWCWEVSIYFYKNMIMEKWNVVSKIEGERKTLNQVQRLLKIYPLKEYFELRSAWSKMCLLCVLKKLVLNVKRWNCTWRQCTRCWMTRIIMNYQGQAITISRQNSTAG